jgi:hypothetical protein
MQLFIYNLFLILNDQYRDGQQLVVDPVCSSRMSGSWLLVVVRGCYSPVDRRGVSFLPVDRRFEV